MPRRSSLRHTSGPFVGLLLMVLLLAPASTATLAAPQAHHPTQVAAPQLPPAPKAAWTRNLEPLTIAGSSLPLLDGVPLGELYVYAFVGGTWQQIPFQFDEVTPAGDYVALEDGLLDANDELVFMAMDLGDEARPWQWLEDPASRTHIRYQVWATNPLSPGEEGWVYLYRSSTLSPAHADYVSWDGATNRILGGSYVIGFAPSQHFGLDRLELNGTGVDLADRAKLRVSGQCRIFGFWVPFSLTENDFLDVSQAPTIDGAVRLGGGTVQNSAWSYHSLSQSLFQVDVDSITPPGCEAWVLDSLRLSLDWLNPASSGMAPMTYYDDNTPGGVLVDGVPDSVPLTPANAWKQVSGARGSVVEVVSYSLGGGTVKNYYRDNQTVDPGDTGDQRSYGDAGYRVDSPSGLVTIGLSSFYLPANQPNVGEIYNTYLDQPLQATPTARAYDCRAAELNFAWQPRPVYAGIETTFTASVGGGEPPFTGYDWTFSDGGTASGNPTSYTFATPGLHWVTLTVTNACGVSDPLSKPVLVFAPGQAHLAYLPVCLRQQP